MCNQYCLNMMSSFKVACIDTPAFTMILACDGACNEKISYIIKTAQIILPFLLKDMICKAINIYYYQKQLVCQLHWKANANTW